MPGSSDAPLTALRQCQVPVTLVDAALTALGQCKALATSVGIHETLCTSTTSSYKALLARNYGDGSTTNLTQHCERFVSYTMIDEAVLWQVSLLYSMTD